MATGPSPTEINKFLEGYISDPSVAKALVSQGAAANPIFAQQLKEIALDFIKMLHEASKVTKCGHALIPDLDEYYFNEEIGEVGSADRIYVRTAGNGTVVSLILAENGERFLRESMYPRYPRHAYDIVGLITTGYSSSRPKKNPWGIWRSPHEVHDGTPVTPPHLANGQWGIIPRPFVQDTAARFEQKWKSWGATVTKLPKGWK